MKPNIIPEKSEMEYYIRAPNTAQLKVFTDKVMSCFQAAATATGCQVEVKAIERAFDNLMSNETLAKLYADNLRGLGTDFTMTLKEIGSTDMGNVSYTVPSIHPMYKIGSGEVYHSHEFTSVTNTPEAHTQTLLAAKAMVYTGINVLTTPGLLEDLKTQFQENLQMDYM